jgi:hypothetical protein
MYHIGKLNNPSKEITERKIISIKQQVIEHVYNTIDISRFKFELLKFTKELPQLLNKKYLVSANFSGSNCLLVFVKIRDKYYQYLIDRKTLSYNSQKINMENVKMYPVKLKLDINLYKESGTIFDGIYIQGKNNKTFVITDAYVFKGQDMTNTTIDNKLLTTRTYLESNYDPSDRENDIVVTVNRLYDIKNVESLINTVIPRIKDFVVRGICFYPERSDTKLIFMFDNDTQPLQKEHPISNFRDQSRDQYKDTQIKYSNNPYKQQEESPKNNLYNQEDLSEHIPKKIEKNIYMPKDGKPDKSYIFEMQKTNTVDVYNLNIVQSVIKDGKSMLKRIKVCLAFVPNLEKSRWCENLFESSDSDTILVNCKYHEDKQKWEPIKVVTDAKKPSLTNDFEICQMEL